MGLLKSIQWVKEPNFHYVVFKLDCQVIANHDKTPRKEVSEYGIIVRACHDFLSSSANFGVSFVRREENNVAHSLAKAILFLASSSIFYHVPPCIEPLIFNEMR